MRTKRLLSICLAGAAALAAAPAGAAAAPDWTPAADFPSPSTPLGAPTVR